MPSEILDSEVKARVPKVERERVDYEVIKRRRSGARVSRGDIVREALHEYFDARRSRKSNGKRKELAAA